MPERLASRRTSRSSSSLRRAQGIGGRVRRRGRHREGCARTGWRRPSREYTQRFDRIAIDPETLTAPGIDLLRGRRALQDRRARGARLRGERDRGLSRAPEADGPQLHGQGRAGTRLALERHRCGRPLCSRRTGELSELGPDERHPGEGGRRLAPGHDVAGSGRRVQSGGGLCGRARRRDRILSDRRGAGRGGAGLWGGQAQAGRQDRRPGQRLCRGRQAHRLRRCRHRHHCRSIRDHRRRRQQERAGMDRRRPAVAGRA